MQRRKPISADLVEMVCEHCKRGYMRVIPGARVIHSNPKMWQHACSNCKEEVWFTVAYPCIEYRGESFMLEKHARFQTEITPVQMKNE
ncbi:hypothetical protein AYI77_02130 [Shewanella algae]|nr:hypothetical protein AYI77_02130 [Shewanella algae]